jgi:signal transduction histidine kinase
MALSVPVRSSPSRLTAELSAHATPVVGVAGIALGVLTGFITYTGNDPGAAGAAIVRGATVLLPIAVGLFICARLPEQRFGLLLVIGGFATFPATLSASGDEVLYSIGRVVTWLDEVALVYLILAFPSGRLIQRIDRALVGLIALVVLLLFLPTALLTDAYPTPSIWTTCVDDCPGNAFQLVDPAPGWVAGAVEPVREVLASLLFVGVSVRLLARIVRATTPLRRTLTPVLAGAVVHAVALPVAFSVRRAGDAPEPLLTLLWLLAVGLPVLAVGFLVGAARWRLAIAGALYRMAPRLHGGTSPAELRAILADTMEDPTVDVAYRGSDGEWLDASGVPVALPAPGSGRAHTVIRDGDAEVAAIVHDEALEEQRSFVRAVGAFAVMVLANQRLTAQVEASLQELRGSRERILAAADHERRRIERDLHDGAQQRLVALRIKLQLASDRSADDGLPDAAHLEQLGEEVGAALDEIRSLAAGVYPGVLVDGGLQDALRAVARRSPVPTSVSAEGLPRRSEEVEAAVYFCCVEAMQNAVKHAQAASVSVVVTDGDRLRFEVRDDGRGFDRERAVGGRGLTNIRDRLSAVGGTLVVESRRGCGTSVTGTIPLADAPPRSR